MSGGLRNVKRCPSADRSIAAGYCLPGAKPRLGLHVPPSSLVLVAGPLRHAEGAADGRNIPLPQIGVRLASAAPACSGDEASGEVRSGQPVNMNIRG